MTKKRYGVINAALLSALVLVAASTLPSLASVLVNTNSNKGTNAFGAVADNYQTTCEDKKLAAMHAIYDKIDTEKVKAKADKNEDKAAREKGFNSAFNSINTGWTWDPATCDNLTLTSVNVVYTLNDGKEDVKNIVVSFDPTITNVTEVSEHPVKKFQSQSSSNIWSGYEFPGNSGATVDVYEAFADWTIPSVSEPSSGFCFFQHCDLAMFVGLVDVLGGFADNKLVQAGTDSGLYCTAGCSFFYYAWYELIPSAPVQCRETFNVGQTVTTAVTNHGKSNGSTTLYDLTISNWSNGQLCSALNQSYTAMPHPKYAEFINERPAMGQTPARLPKFTSDTMFSGSLWYSGSSKSIYTPYFNHWENKVLMQNGAPGNTNISVGVVTNPSGAGQFTQTWANSNGT